LDEGGVPVLRHWLPTTTLTFGVSAITDEMCVLGGVYYPVDDIPSRSAAHGSMPKRTEPESTRLGKPKIKVSHAEAFRRDLGRAFGLETWHWNPPNAKGEQKTGEYRETEGRVMTPRERELLEPSDYTLPVDFHSWRRAYSQALADADVNAQQASALAGHSSLGAHQARVIPLAALPRLEIKAASLPNALEPANETGVISAGRTGLEPSDG
jgi:hypothetical protein